MAYLRSVDMPFLFQLQFTSTSFFWLLFCIVLGISYALLMYTPKVFNRGVNKVLFVFRSLSVAGIAFLLFAPMIKFTGTTTEKPLIILAQDNSKSISLSKPANFNLSTHTQHIQKLQQELAKDYDVKSLTFGTQIRPGINASFEEPLSDINALFKYVNEQYPNRNIGAVILASDGIYNQGGNPEFEAQNLKSPIYSIALGDTIPKKDLIVSNVNYNNIAYLGNDFQIEISIEAFQCRAAVSRLTVSDASGVITTKGISIGSNEYRINVPVTLSAKKKGIQRFTVQVSPVSGELLTENNKQTFFVEVIDAKNKILILANSPHPDIAALKQSISSNKNYEVNSVLINDYKASDVANADLVILHQLPSASINSTALISSLERKPIWFILGAQTSFSNFSALQNLLSLNAAGATEEASARINPDFYEFTLTEQTRNSIQNFGPIISPFGNYALKGDASILLHQQIGKLLTNRPLLLFSKDLERKIGVFAGEGIWRWRLENFQESGNHQAVDELVSKVVQFMVTKADKRNFRVYPSKTTFDESEHVILNSELYNSNYELVNTPDVAITIKSAGNKSYPFLFTRTVNAYLLDAGILPAGEYSFIATTQLGKVKHSAKGEFFITKQQTEYRRTTADHQLLFNLSELNNGEMIFSDGVPGLADKIRKNELIKTILYEDRRFEELINLKFIFFVLIMLLGAEWFLRKMDGRA
ncbi:MAG: hypothetical protein H7Y07_17345 [Pyrinomonadaceae bacterium]|nr:hypothetical protein [Sphingobacteriaceae bacterium]